MNRIFSMARAIWMLQFAAALFATGVGLTAQTVATGSGIVTGTVVDDGGAIVEDAFVTAISMRTANNVKLTPVTAFAASHKGGAFEIDGLPPGSYKICVSKPGSALLDPCAWADGSPWVSGSTLIAVANVTAGATASGIKAVAIRGTTITVGVSDVANVIGQNGGKSDVLVGIRHGGGPFIPASLVSSDSGGKTYSLVVPQGKAANVSVYSKAFVLADEQGKEFTTSEVSLPITANSTNGGNGTNSTGATNSVNGNGKPTISVKISRASTAAATPVTAQ